MAHENDIHSSTKQALIDLHAKAVEHGNAKLAQEIKSLITSISTSIYTDADNKFNTHNYPDRRISWSRKSKYIECPALYELSDTAFKLFMFLVDVAGKDNAVRFVRQDIIKVFGWSEATVKRTVRELKESGFIVEKISASGRQGAIYLLNPRVAYTGTNTLLRKAIKDFESTASKKALLRFAELNKTRCAVATGKYKDEELTQGFTQIEFIDTKAKETSNTKEKSNTKKESVDVAASTDPEIEALFNNLDN